MNVKKTFLYCTPGMLIASFVHAAEILIEQGLLPNYRNIPHYTLKDGCYIGQRVRLGEGVRLSPFVTIGDDVSIGQNTYIEPQVTIGSGCILGENCRIHAGARIGTDSYFHYEENGHAKTFGGAGRVVMGDYVEVGANSVIQRGTLSDTAIGSRVRIGNLVLIAHDVKIAADTRIVCQSGIAGRATLGEKVLLMGQTGVVDGVHLGNGTVLLGKSVATKNAAAGTILSGMYGRPHKEELKWLATLRRKEK